MQHMIDDPRMGTLVVASSGADAQASQVISQRDRTDKGVVFLWTGSRDAKAGLGLLKTARIPVFYTPTRWPEACGAFSRIIQDASAAWPMALPLHHRAPLGRMQRSPGRLGWGVRHSRSPRASSCLAAWGVGSAREHLAASAEAAVAARNSSDFRWFSKSIRRIFCTRPRPGWFG